jgi:hypothetical protein
MRVLIALSSFILGSSLADKYINKLIPDVDFDNEDCLGDACFKRNQLLSVDRSKTDPSTGLAYNERSLAYASTQSLLPTCLPNVAKEAVADSFTSYKGKKMEDICVFTKRGWLVKDAQEESVANVDFSKTAFSGPAGGDEAVKKCLKIQEEAEVDDYAYEYYDYADYYDAYDYLEEGEGIERRVRRAAGNGGKEKKKGGKNGNGKNMGRKGKKNNGKGEKKNNGKKGKKNDGRKGKNTNGRNSKNDDGKKKNGKNKGKKNGGKKNGKGKNDDKPAERKFVKKPSKRPSAENVEQNNKQIDVQLKNPQSVKYRS